MLFHRVVNVRISPKNGKFGLDLSNLDCIFHVKKSLKPEPNTCELKVYNLAESSRKMFERGNSHLKLDAGYPDGVAQIFRGEVRSAHSRREGADIVTEVSTGDSEKEMQEAHISTSVGAGVSVQSVLEQLVGALGVEKGNVHLLTNALAARGMVMFGPGSALFGYAAEELTALCESVGLEWSIQDGALQILQRGKPLKDQAILLTSDTGLVESPTIDHKGVASLTALIQPSLVPGRLIKVESIAFKGVFRIESCEYVGDTAGKEWYVQIQAKAPKT